MKLWNEQERYSPRRSSGLIANEVHELEAKLIEILPVMVLRVKRESAEMLPIIAEGISLYGHLSTTDISIELFFS